MHRILSLSLLFLVTALALPASARADDPPAAAHHARLSLEQHFNQANLSHDGHLTAEEAKAGFPALARHFSNIDVDGKGYVTLNDVRAWNALRKATRGAQQKPEDPYRPRNAYQRQFPGEQTPSNNTSAHMTLFSGQ